MYAAMSFSISYLSNACCCNCCCCCGYIAENGKCQSVFWCCVDWFDDASKTKRRRSLKKSKFLTTQTKAKCDFPRSRGGRENKKEGLTHNFGAIYRVLYDFLFRVFSMSEWKREESISVISCSSKETIRFSSQKRLLVWLSKILQRRDDARANYFYSSLSFDDAPLSCPQTWWTVSFVLRCCCCSPFWCFVVDNRRRVVVMSDCFLCLYPRNKKWRQKWKFRQKNWIQRQKKKKKDETV